MASGDTKTEALMNILENGGSIEGISGSGNTKFQDYIVDNILSIDSAKDAIASKGGTVGDTGLAGLADEIASIPSGGGSDMSDDVRFIDYDGTIVAQMSIAEAQTLTALPEGPTHDLLEFNGWTHTLQEINATTRKLDIGATYVSANDYRETIIEVCPDAQGANLQSQVVFTQDTDRGVLIDWGDGSAKESFSGVDTGITATHTYTSQNGNPVYIRVQPNKNVNVTITFANSYYRNILVGDCTIYNDSIGSTGPRNLIISEHVKNTQINIRNAVVLTAIIVPYCGVTTVKIDSCSSLRYVVCGRNITDIGMPSNPGITRVTIPENVTSLSNGMSSQGCFAGDRALYEIIMNDKVETIAQRSFMQVRASIVIPSSVTSIGSSVIRTFYGERIIFDDRQVMPTSVSDTFMQQTATFTPTILDFTRCTQVPTQETSDFLSSYSAYYIIHVPASLETQWKQAANWSQYAGIIVGV